MHYLRSGPSISDRGRRGEAEGGKSTSREGEEFALICQASGCKVVARLPIDSCDGDEVEW